MPEQPVWKWLRESADREMALKNALHDATGEHTWFDATTYGDQQQHFVCQFCGADKWTPFCEPGER